MEHPNKNQPNPGAGVDGTSCRLLTSRARVVLGVASPSYINPFANDRKPDAPPKSPPQIQNTHSFSSALNPSPSSNFEPTNKMDRVTTYKLIRSYPDADASEHMYGTPPDRSTAPLLNVQFSISVM